MRYIHLSLYLTIGLIACGEQGEQSAQGGAEPRSIDNVWSGDLIIGAISLETINAYYPIVTGSLIISSNKTSTSIDLPALTTVGRDVNIHHNEALTSIDLSALTTVEQVVFRDNGACNNITIDDLPCSCENDVITRH